MQYRTEINPQARYAPINTAYYQQRARQLKLQNQALRQQTAYSNQRFTTQHQPQYVPLRVSPPRYAQYRPHAQNNFPMSYYTDNSYIYSGVQNSLIELQSRNQRLERQANQLQTSIKADLMHFVRDSNIHRDCSYKQKYIKSLNYRPQYSRINFR